MMANLTKRRNGMILTLSASEVRKMYQIQNMHTGRIVELSNVEFNWIFDAVQDLQEKYQSIGYIEEHERLAVLAEIESLWKILNKL